MVGKTNYNPINRILLPEIAADLRSPDPQVRATTRGQIYLGNAFGLSFNWFSLQQHISTS